MFYDTRDSNVWRELLRKEERHVARYKCKRPITAPVVLRTSANPMPPTTLSKMLATMHSQDARETAASKLLRKQGGKQRAPAASDEWDLTAAAADFVPKLRSSNDPLYHHILLRSPRGGEPSANESYRHGVLSGSESVWVPARVGSQPSWEPRHTARRAMKHDEVIAEARNTLLGTARDTRAAPRLSCALLSHLVSRRLISSVRSPQAT